MAHPARPTVYRGTRMRSRLEAHYAAHLDDMGQEWVYEPMVFADGFRQYLPDFMLPHVHSPLSDREHGWGDQSLFIEVKGAEPSPADLDHLQQQMCAVFASEPAAQLAIVTEKMMRAGCFLFYEAPPCQAFRFGVWEYAAWAECRCGSCSPVVLRNGRWLGQCPDCGGSVFVSLRRMWLPAA